MKLTDIRKKEDCFDGSAIFEYFFDAALREGFIRRFAADGRLYLYSHFPRPFFKILQPDGVQVNGILGDRSLEAVFPRTRRSEVKAGFEENLTLCLKDERATEAVAGHPASSHS